MYYYISTAKNSFEWWYWDRSFLLDGLSVCPKNESLLINFDFWYVFFFSQQLFWWEVVVVYTKCTSSCSHLLPRMWGITYFNLFFIFSHVFCRWEGNLCLNFVITFFTFFNGNPDIWKSGIELVIASSSPFSVIVYADIAKNLVKMLFSISWIGLSVYVCRYGWNGNPALSS